MEYVSFVIGAIGLSRDVYNKCGELQRSRQEFGMLRSYLRAIIEFLERARARGRLAEHERRAIRGIRRAVRYAQDFVDHWRPSGWDIFNGPSLSADIRLVCDRLDRALNLASAYYTLQLLDVLADLRHLEGEMDHETIPAPGQDDEGPSLHAEDDVRPEQDGTESVFSRDTSIYHPAPRPAPHRTNHVGGDVLIYTSALWMLPLVGVSAAMTVPAAVAWMARGISRKDVAAELPDDIVLGHVWRSAFKKMNDAAAAKRAPPSRCGCA